MRSFAPISIYPSRQNAILARKQFFFTMYSSLAYLLSLAGEQDDQCSMDRFLARRRAADILDPNIFYCHDALLKAMREQNVSEVSSIVAELQTMAETKSTKPGPATAGPEILSLGETKWEDFIVKSSLDLGEKAFNQRPTILPVPSDVVAEQVVHIHDAISLIEKFFPAMHLELLELLSKIRIFEGAVTMGITDVRMYGCMFIRTPRSEVNPVLYYGEHLTHEVSHMYLNAAMAIDPIILNKKEELFRSPIRKDPRPMMGVFHATFVTSRIVQLFSSIADHDASDEVLGYLHQQLDELIVGTNEVEKGAKLTSAGQDIVDEFNELIDNVRGRSFWENYDATKPREHRFGGGAIYAPAILNSTTANTFQRTSASI